jgi:hypothetical protein
MAIRQSEAIFYCTSSVLPDEEDPRRIIYPILDQAQDLPAFHVSHLECAKVIAPTVSTVLFKQKNVRLQNDRQPYLLARRYRTHIERD